MTIRLREILREAWRNLTTGTTRALIAAVALTLVVGTAGAAQARSVVGVAQDALTWRAQGSATNVVGLDGRIDGAQCDALATLPGVAAAGAVRAADPVRLAALPSSPVQTFEATPGLAGVLHLAPLGAAVPGVWVDQAVAADLGVHPGDGALPRTEGGPMNVAGTYPYPADGRSPTLAYSVVAPVLAAGVFDACWVETWPETEAVAPLLTLPVVGGTDAGGDQLTPMVRQLNASGGRSFNPEQRLADLPTLPLTVAALVGAAAIAFILVRIRRLELAAALHAGIDKVSLLVQLAVEALSWAVVSCALVVPVVWWAAAHGNPDPVWTAFHPALRTTLLAVVVVLATTLTAGASTRERHLFRYFKQR